MAVAPLARGFVAVNARDGRVSATVHRVTAQGDVHGAECFVSAPFAVLSTETCRCQPSVEVEAAGEARDNDGVLRALVLARVSHGPACAALPRRHLLSPLVVRGAWASVGTCDAPESATAARIAPRGGLAACWLAGGCAVAWTPPHPPARLGPDRACTALLGCVDGAALTPQVAVGMPHNASVAVAVSGGRAFLLPFGGDSAEGLDCEAAALVPPVYACVATCNAVYRVEDAVVSLVGTRTAQLCEFVDGRPRRVWTLPGAALELAVPCATPGAPCVAVVARGLPSATLCGLIPTPPGEQDARCPAFAPAAGVCFVRDDGGHAVAIAHDALGVCRVLRGNTLPTDGAAPLAAPAVARVASALARRKAAGVAARLSAAAGRDDRARAVRHALRLVGGRAGAPPSPPLTAPLAPVAGTVSTQSRGAVSVGGASEWGADATGGILIECEALAWRVSHRTLRVEVVLRNRSSVPLNNCALVLVEPTPSRCFASARTRAVSVVPHGTASLSLLAEALAFHPRCARTIAVRAVWVSPNDGQHAACMLGDIALDEGVFLPQPDDAPPLLGNPPPWPCACVDVSCASLAPSALPDLVIRAVFPAGGTREVCVDGTVVMQGDSRGVFRPFVHLRLSPAAQNPRVVRAHVFARDHDQLACALAAVKRGLPDGAAVVGADCASCPSAERAVGECVVSMAEMSDGGALTAAHSSACAAEAALRRELDAIAAGDATAARKCAAATDASMGALGELR